MRLKALIKCVKLVSCHSRIILKSENEQRATAFLLGQKQRLESELFKRDDERVEQSSALFS